MSTILDSDEVKQHNRDFNIFDQEIIIEWEENGNGENHSGDLKLICNDKDKYFWLFGLWNTSEKFMTVEQIQAEIDKAKNTIV